MMVFQVLPGNTALTPSSRQVPAQLHGSIRGDRLDSGIAASYQTKNNACCSADTAAVPDFHWLATCSSKLPKAIGDRCPVQEGAYFDI